VQAGVYSFPTLGLPYMRAGKTTQDFYGPVPQAFVKLMLDDHWSILAGKIPSLGGGENTFTYQNANIERGLLWSQTSSISRGAQINYAADALSAGLAWTDGFYSNHYSWLSGTASYALDSANSLTVIGAANLQATSVSTIAAPLAQNNSQIYNLIYTYKSGPLTLSPYLQVTRVPKAPWIGLASNANTRGAALLASYNFDPGAKIGDVDMSGVSVALRAEYILARSQDALDAPILLYGPISSAWSLTVTPTYRFGPAFARAELSHVRAASASSGAIFGKDGSKSEQSRALIEVGFLY